MSKKPPTMSHTPEQRKVWHEEKRRPGESKDAWKKRVTKAKKRREAAQANT